MSQYCASSVPWHRISRLSAYRPCFLSLAQISSWGHDWGFCWFLQANSGIGHQIEPNRFLPYPLSFIIHWSSFCSVWYSGVSMPQYRSDLKTVYKFMYVLNKQTHRQKDKKLWRISIYFYFSLEPTDLFLDSLSLQLFNFDEISA